MREFYDGVSAEEALLAFDAMRRDIDGDTDFGPEAKARAQQWVESTLTDEEDRDEEANVIQLFPEE